jgi:hypothetical protein
MKNIIFVSLFVIIACGYKSSNSPQIKQNSIHTTNYDSTSINAFDLPQDLKLAIQKKLHLKQLNMLGSFKNMQSKEVYLIEGDYWDETYHEWNMYVVLNSKDADSSDMGKYSLPGKEYDFYDTLIYETRVFYGQCLKKYPCSIVWYQKTLMDKTKKWEMDYYILDVSSDKFKAYRFKEREINLKEILDNLAGNKCVEIPGKEIRSEP